MERLDPEDLSSALLAVPPNWIAGMLSADPEWRERSAETVATNVIEILDPCALDAANQLALPLDSPGGARLWEAPCPRAHPATLPAS